LGQKYPPHLRFPRELSNGGQNTGRVAILTRPKKEKGHLGCAVAKNLKRRKKDVKPKV